MPSRHVPPLLHPRNWAACDSFATERYAMFHGNFSLCPLTRQAWNFFPRESSVVAWDPPPKLEAVQHVSNSVRHKLLSPPPFCSPGLSTGPVPLHFLTKAEKASGRKKASPLGQSTKAHAHESPHPSGATAKGLLCLVLFCFLLFLGADHFISQCCLRILPPSPTGACSARYIRETGCPELGGCLADSGSQHST